MLFKVTNTTNLQLLRNIPLMLYTLKTILSEKFEISKIFLTTLGLSQKPLNQY